MQNIVVTKHARQRLIERIGSRKIGLYLLRCADTSAVRTDGMTVYFHGGFRFIVDERGKAAKLITVLNNSVW